MIASRRRFLQPDRQREPADRIPPERIARDPLRPQSHLLPARNWMNDPNGPIFWRGNYHNPNVAVGGDVHWAHATSADMLPLEAFARGSRADAEWLR
jgi:sucrose-6-phosphate hydrolase SacC (GH32 family)